MRRCALARDGHRLAALVGCAPDLDRGAGTPVRDEVLLDTRRRARDGDHGTRRGDDLLGAAVVVSEHELAVLRVLAGEPVEVGAARAAELVDRLVVVGDDEEVAMARHERLHQLRLRVVGVLVLVHHHVGDAIRDGAARRRLLADESLRVEDAVVEVEDARTPVALVEARVDAGDILMALEDDALGRILALGEPRRPTTPRTRRA